MKCPFCNFEETKVLDKRPADEHANRRRRECIKCAKRFTTYERIESTPIIVIKKDGKREQFDPQKIRKGILTASQKTKLTLAQVDTIVVEIENEVKKRRLFGLEKKIAVVKSGNSLVFRIPPEIVSFSKIKQKDEVLIFPVGENRIEIELLK